MAITLESINLIITLKNINYCYPGGFDLFSKHNRNMFGETFCHDALLFRAGAADPHDIENMVLYWQERGLVPYAEIYGIKQWKDMCVVQSSPLPIASRPSPKILLSFPCEWIEIDQQNNCVSLKGKPKGRIIGIEEMKLYYNL